jgi:hypothetical protein
MELEQKNLEDRLKTPFVILFEDEIMNTPNDNNLGKYVREKFEKSKKKS